MLFIANLLTGGQAGRSSVGLESSWPVNLLPEGLESAMGWSAVHRWKHDRRGLRGIFWTRFVSGQKTSSDLAFGDAGFATIVK